jgi:hypothetical protein
MLAELLGVTADIHSLSRLHASISWQQSRSLWLKEGDANTKYFHSVLASRRRGNTISVIQADGVTLEGVTPIRQTVFSHFASHFKAVVVPQFCPGFSLHIGIVSFLFFINELYFLPFCFHFIFTLFLFLFYQLGEFFI